MDISVPWSYLHDLRQMKLEAGRDEGEGHLGRKKDVEMELQKILSILLVAFEIKVILMLLSKARAIC